MSFCRIGGKTIGQDNTGIHFVYIFVIFHPFMDGNGRATRFFFNSLALAAGYEIGWGSADPDHFLEANVAALDGDYQALIDVLEEIVIPLSED